MGDFMIMLLNKYDLWIFSIFSSFLFVACQKDFYSEITATGTCQGELTHGCDEVITRMAPIDVASFEAHPKEKQDIIRALHLLLTSPLAFPKDKKMFGLGTIKEAGMFDFYERFVRDPDKNLNQEMFNYILNASLEIRYGCNSLTNTSYYTPEAIHICENREELIPAEILNKNEEMRLREERGDAVEMATLLLHEARHSETGQHQVYLPEFTPFLPRADVGMDGPCGWEIGLLWGFMQGNRRENQTYFKRDEVASIAGAMESKFYSIYSLPPLLSKMKEDREYPSYYLKHFPSIENLSYPLLRKTVTLAKEPLTLTPDFQRISQVLVKDIDQDGKSDAIVVGEKQLQIFWGDADRKLKKSAILSMADPIVELVPMNANSDRYLDLLVRTKSDDKEEMYILLLTSSLMGVTKIKIPNYPFPQPVSATKVLDINHDGQRDLFFVLSGFLSRPQWGVMWGTKTPGEFSPLTLLGDDKSGFLKDSEFVDVLDINQDGQEDLIFQSRAAVKLVLGQERGGFQFSTVDYQPKDAGGVFDGFVVKSYMHQAKPALFAIDLNQLSWEKSGFSSTLLSYRANILALDEQKNLRTLRSAKVRLENLRTTAIDDITEDGYPDILELENVPACNGLVVFASLEDDGYDEGTSRVSFSEEAGCLPPLVGDFDGDGQKDVLVHGWIGFREQNRLFVFFNDSAKSPTYTW